jgi:hypothetical protein
MRFTFEMKSVDGETDHREPNHNSPDSHPPQEVGDTFGATARRIEGGLRAIAAEEEDAEGTAASHKGAAHQVNGANDTPLSAQSQCVRNP